MAYEGQVELFSIITKEKYISFTKNIQSTANKNSIKLRFIDINFSILVSINWHLFSVKVSYEYCNANYPQKILMF